MNIQFWGTRGSIAKSSADVLRYGGNTSCVEIRSNANDLLILDAGTGLHGLSQKLLSEQKPLKTASILISHTHWDHIQGLPFFIPFFNPNIEWNIFGPPTLSQDLESILSGQMQKTYFPITQELFNAKINYHNIKEGGFTIGDIYIKTQYLNHPGVTMGYRIEVDGHTIVYSTDHEPHDCRLAHGGEIIKGSEDELHARFLDNADYVIHDAQYVANEYERHRGWGHSTMEYVVDLAHHADVKNLILFHHDPLRSDPEIDQIVDLSRSRLDGKAGKMNIWGAAENRPLWIEPKLILPGSLRQALFSSNRSSEDRENTSILEQLPTLYENILCFKMDTNIQMPIELAKQNLIFAYTIEEAAQLNQQYKPKLIFIKAEDIKLLNLFYHTVFSTKIHSFEPQVVVFCQADECSPFQLSTLSPQPIRMVQPVSDIYLSSRIETWLRRLKHKSDHDQWQRGLIPNNEQDRLNTVNHVLDILKDTKIKEVLRQLIELVWQAFMLPTRQLIQISINIITSDQQRTLLTFPTPPLFNCDFLSRDESICSHVIANGSSLTTFYTSTDSLLKKLAQFKDTASQAIIRSYIGKPIYVNNQAVGTLCCFSSMDLELKTEHDKLLENVLSLIEKTLGSE